MTFKGAELLTSGPTGSHNKWWSYFIKFKNKNNSSILDQKCSLRIFYRNPFNKGEKVKKQKSQKNGFCQKKELKYKNKKAFYQKSVSLRFLQFWKNLKKDNFCLFLTKNAFCEDVLQKFVEKGVKKQKKI